MKTSELQTNRNDKGWCGIYNTLDQGWSETLHRITIDCNEGGGETLHQITIDCNEGRCETLHQITIDCSEGRSETAV